MEGKKLKLFDDDEPTPQLVKNVNKKVEKKQE
jgi:hypothetical protein